MVFITERLDEEIEGTDILTKLSDKQIKKGKDIFITC